MSAMILTQNPYRKTGILIILLILITIQKSYSQEVFKFPEDHFEITLPVDWKEIPKNEIDKNSLKAQKKMGTKKETNYVVGFQKRLSKSWFSMPYMLINVERAGRISNSDINDITARMDKVLKEIISSDNTKLRDIVKNLKRNEAYYEKDKSRIITSMDYSVNNSTISGLFIMQLTSYGVLNLFFYTDPKNWDKDYRDFLEIADNVKIDSAFKYENIELQKNNVKVNNIIDSGLENTKSIEDQNSFSVKYDIFFPVLNFLFFIIPFIIILLLMRKTNIGNGIIRYATKHRYEVSITICLIFMLIQISIISSLTLPLILNLFLIYPLSKFFIYCKESSTLNHDNEYSLQNSIKGIERTEPTKTLKENSSEKQADAPKSSETNIILPINEEENEEKNEEGIATIDDKEFVCICSNCKNEIVVDEIEIQSNKYICPECETENEIEKHQIISSAEDIIEGPSGLGGWLILPSIGIVINILFCIGETVQYLNLDQSHIPKYLINFGVLKNISLAILLLVVAYYFYGKKKRAPTLIIAYLVISTVLGIVEVDQINSSVFSSESNKVNSNSMSSEVIRSIVGTIFWSLYFMMSRRVKNTFIN